MLEKKEFLVGWCVDSYLALLTCFVENFNLQASYTIAFEQKDFEKDISPFSRSCDNLKNLALNTVDIWEQVTINLRYSQKFVKASAPSEKLHFVN